MITLRAALPLVYLVACAGPAGPPPSPAPVKVQGQRQDIRLLAGTWVGEFRGAQDDRHGRIAFALAVDSDSAFGSVTLETPPAAAACADIVRPIPPAPLPATIVLRFSSLATAGGSVGGWLQPYTDPEAGCQVDTWFEGRVIRDTLRGMYFSRRSDHTPVRRGEWWAGRAPTRNPKQR